MTQHGTDSSRLLEAIDVAQAHANDEFGPGAPVSMDGVIWLSAHLAALDHAIHPAIARALPAAHEALAKQRRSAGRLQTMLRDVERRHACDALASHAPWESSRAELMKQLIAHAKAEREMVQALVLTIGPQAGDDLLDRYTHALAHGPTRPHPYGPHRGLLGRFAYRLDALRDHVLDTMDGRINPMPRILVQHKTPGRWGRYLLGVNDPQDLDRSA
jgi:hypothetical protein